MMMSATSTTGRTGIHTIARPQPDRTNAPEMISARFARVRSMKAPTAGCAMMPMRPLVESTAPIAAWRHCAFVSRKTFT